MATKKILLTRTAVVKGRHYLPDPDKLYEFDAEIVDELVDKNAGEPVMDLPGTRQENDTDDPDPGLKSNLKKKNR
ncbi:hypothetical protein [Desulfotignum phosphitoxidans]|uniref:Uncharacterized protein n=1 Tax=Desulfotignum phosphitoxidans DSM 13687 TaxID=1286635 RepID=S0FVX7_9BACT|nr:hypothetical protein [Desulfotignum phosphitoxidans]EMS79203.1 hypothetical protein Dpo_5c01260 [Desulfotignum phosphitoxidans DSM 13687]